MQKQLATKLSALTLSGFLSNVQKNVDPDNARTIKRYMQKGIFEELWQRAHVNDDVAKTTTYTNVGLLAANLFKSSSGRPSLAFRKQVKLKPITGNIRSRMDFHDDIRFILTVVDDQFCLLLDNSAIDSRMATVMLYDAVETTFVNVDTPLIDFVLTNDLKM